MTYKYTEEENGLLNNFAIEPKVYSSDTDGEQQKKNYLIVGLVGLLLVLGLIAVTFTIS